VGLCVIIYNKHVHGKPLVSTSTHAVVTLEKPSRAHSPVVTTCSTRVAGRLGIARACCGASVGWENKVQQDPGREQPSLQVSAHRVTLAPSASHGVFCVHRWHGKAGKYAYLGCLASVILGLSTAKSNLANGLSCGVLLLGILVFRLRAAANFGAPLPS
jgi:hypothetical protein